MRVSSYALAATVVVFGLPGIGCSDSSKMITGPTLGLLSIAVASSGASIDVPGGFSYAVDGQGPFSILANAAVMYGNLPAGRHEVELRGVTANCSIDGGSKRSVDVTAGGNVTAAFAVSCLANTGTLTLTTVTHGSVADLIHYTIELPGIGAVELDPNGTRTFENVRVGSFRLTLTTVAPGCQLSGFPSANVEFAASSEVVLVIQCFSSDQISSIAYVSESGVDADIYVIKPNGADNVRITTQPGADTDPAWSPDHNKIAFASDRDGNREIYVMNADGTNQVRLTNSGAGDYNPAWSPDGGRIAFVSERTSDPEIWVMDADGKNQTRLTNDLSADLEPDWSPDGKRIAFHRDNWATDAGNGIYTMLADGTDVRQLTVSYRGDWEPAWSPDGSKIAFARASYYTTDIYIVNVNGGEVQLTRDLPFVTDPTWSPDGVYIAFASIPSVYDASKSEILVIASNGSSATPIKASAPASNPAWR